MSAAPTPTFSLPQNLLPPSTDARRQARTLFWMGWDVTSIAEQLRTPRGTVAAWKSRDGWDDARPTDRVEATLEMQLIQLIAKPVKDGRDVRDIDLLTRQLERLARVRRYQQPGGHEGDLNPNVAARNAGPKKKPVKNFFDAEAVAQLRAAFESNLFGYQRLWRDNADLRTRVILKSRQIGATWYFAREALLDAIETGRNQIFLSASKSQARVFREYITAFAKAEAGVDLTGDPIIIDRGEGQEPATLYFLGTNAKTAQSYHGNFYFDEFFWVHGFKTLNKVASAMATHKKWRKTYFSTPSSITHEAYEFWTGADRNKRRAKADRADIDVSHQTLRRGAIAADRRWRNVVTVLDAEEDGCGLFDIEEIRDENSPADFANLYLCEFVDDTESVFPMALMSRCFVDMIDAWPDFDFEAKLLGRRPFGDREVWVGYDPSHTGDTAALVVMAPPAVPGGKFRILETMRFRGMDFADQAEAIRQATLRYNVTKIDIDMTGLGLGVFQLVQVFFPGARGIQYTPEVKNRLVLKAMDTISRGRLEYDQGDHAITQSFMAIRKAMTASGRAATYEAGRSEETGHADLAWAAMHALDNEPLNAVVGGDRRGFMEIDD